MLHRAKIASMASTSQGRLPTWLFSDP